MSNSIICSVRRPRRGDEILLKTPRHGKVRQVAERPADFQSKGMRFRESFGDPRLRLASHKEAIPGEPLKPMVEMIG